MKVKISLCNLGEQFLERDMRKPPIKVLLALLTFIVDAGTAMSWVLLRRNSARESPLQPLPYCEVARNPERYHGKVIRVKAALSSGSGGMYVVEDCDPVSALASLVELEGSESSGPKAGNYVEEMLTDQTEFQVKKIDTVIIGRFDGEYSRGCWLPTYRIAATSIEEISP